MARFNRRFGFTDPFDLLREMNTFFGNTPSPTGRSRTWRGRARAGVFPPVNIYDDGESFLVRAEIPGVDKDDLNLSAKGDQLTIRGERQVAEADEGANYHRRERESGTFRRVVTLPEAIEPDKVQATYDDGVLEVYTPRAAETRPRQITVNQ